MSDASRSTGAATGSTSAPRLNRERWRQSEALALAELAVFALIFWADWKHLIFFSKTLYLLPLAWISLWLRGLRWKNIGWGRYQTWKKTLLFGVVSAFMITGFELFVSGPLLTRLSGRPADLEDFRELVGNWQLLAIYLALNWPLAAFGEEFIFRGYLLNRLAGLGSGKRLAWIFSLIITSTAFGLAHTYQDVTGAVEAGIDGLLLGLLYLRCDRKLAVPMISHGVSNTIDFILIYLGKYPGM